MRRGVWLAVACGVWAGSARAAPSCEHESSLTVVPSWGPAPSGTRVRVGGIFYTPTSVSLVSADETAYPFALASQESNESDYADATVTWSVFAPPLDLPDGSFRVLIDGTEQASLELRSDAIDGALGATPELLGTETSTFEYYPDTCGGSFSATWDSVVTTWRLPAAPGPGWVAEATEVGSGQWLGWAELEADTVSFSAFFGAPEGIYEEACVRLSIFDARHELAWSQAYPCVALGVRGLFSSCACAQGPGAGPGGTLGSGLLLGLCAAAIFRARGARATES